MNPLTRHTLKARVNVRRSLWYKEHRHATRQKVYTVETVESPQKYQVQYITFNIVLTRHALVYTKLKKSV